MSSTNQTSQFFSQVDGSYRDSTKAFPRFVFLFYFIFPILLQNFWSQWPQHRLTSNGEGYVLVFAARSGLGKSQTDCGIMLFQSGKIPLTNSLDIPRLQKLSGWNWTSSLYLQLLLIGDLFNRRFPPNFDKTSPKDLGPVYEFHCSRLLLSLVNDSLHNVVN
jgi:hypothetical protein